MSMFFADQVSVEEVHFEDDGVTVWIRRYIDAGIRDDIRNQMVRVNLVDEARTDNPSAREARLQTGDLFVLQKMITKVTTEENTFTAPIGMGLLRRMSDVARAKLIAVVNEYNPLPDEEQKTDETEMQVPTS